MSISLPYPSCCCGSDPTSIAGPPGPAGADGSPGVDGVDGVSAFTITTAQFTMPAEMGNVTVFVQDSTWMAVGQLLYVAGAGFLTVLSTPTSGSVSVRNPENTPLEAYASNVTPGTVIGAGAKISPGGIQGPPGQDALAGAAPATARYLVGSATDAPANAIDLGALSTGLVKSTVAGGVSAISIASAITDYLSPSGNLYLSVSTYSFITDGQQTGASFTNAGLIRLVAGGFGPTLPFGFIGFNGAANGRLMVLLNLTGQDWTFYHESLAELSPAKRIITLDGSDATLPGYSIAILVYDGTTARWRLLMLA